ncbi:MAG: hypothetical protein M3Q60_20230, partial [Actinomycetota bacterium]|nr:hypothetical protein [Actinomycetota bacterium]
ASSRAASGGVSFGRAIRWCSFGREVGRMAPFYSQTAQHTSSRDAPEEDRPAMCEDAAKSLARRFSADEIRTIAEMAVRMKGDA